MSKSWNDDAQDAHAHVVCMYKIYAYYSIFCLVNFLGNVWVIALTISNASIQNTERTYVAHNGYWSYYLNGCTNGYWYFPVNLSELKKN